MLSNMSRPKVIGIVGGGQLGRMLTLAAKPLGFDVVVVDPGENCPAVQAGARQIKADLYDATAIAKLGKQSDYITVEIEHLNVSALAKLAQNGVPVNPAPQTIALIQDKYKQKKFLEARGIPVATFEEVVTKKQIKEQFLKFGGKMLLKTRHGAYDGRGNALVTSETELKDALEKFGEADLYAEKFVPFKKELAVMVARDNYGNIKTYPVVETIHERNICVEVLAPAQVKQRIAKRAEKLARKVANHLEGAGVFGIEMFVTKRGKVLINEIAPRVHNSGHYTMDSCATSQFEQHIRAVTGLPLGSTELLTDAAAMVNILGEENHDTEIKGLATALTQPHTYVHTYGKSPTKVDRKMGHINATGKTTNEALVRARRARKALSI
jgi:5-(carboxyamino)imidazole ribonucleotide synthase